MATHYASGSTQLQAGKIVQCNYHAESGIPTFLINAYET